ncbi:GSCOCG00011475001-RA-CDS [Cotesia congregata]|nr:GSCOCG00011475001-RA-CDS [Cotesia congregata]
MSNNNELSSLFTFLSNAVKTLEIPKESPVTCSVEDAPLEKLVITNPEIIGNIKMDSGEEFLYTLKSVEYICQDCNKSFCSAIYLTELHAAHTQEFHVHVGPHKSIGAKNIEEFFKNMDRVSARIPTEVHSSKVTPAREDDKSLLRLSGNRSRVTRSTKHGNSPKSNNLMYTKEEGYYACRMCDSKFCDRENIVKHVRKKHSRMSLENHQSNLPSSTEQKQTMNQILKIKSDCNIQKKNKFKCDLCSCQYKHKRHLTQHKCDKHGEKSIKAENTEEFTCELCSKNYIRKGDLTRHKNMYHSDYLTNGKFKCNICQAQFDSSRSVLIHKRKQHSIE